MSEKVQRGNFGSENGPPKVTSDLCRAFPSSCKHEHSQGPNLLRDELFRKIAAVPNMFHSSSLLSVNYDVLHGNHAVILSLLHPDRWPFESA